MLAGYATYIIAVIGALVTGAYFMGLIDRVQWEQIMGILVPLGAMAFRRAISNVPDKVAVEALAVAKKLAVKEDVHEEKELKTLHDAIEDVKAEVKKAQ